MELEYTKRILIGLLFSTLLVILSIYYISAYRDHLEYPSYETILFHYPYGELVSVYGSVTKIYPGGYLIQDNYHGQQVVIKVNYPYPPNLGDNVAILGILGPDNQIISVKRIVVNQWQKYDFLLLRSFLILIFLLYFFNRYWYFNLKDFEFRRR